MSDISTASFTGNVGRDAELRQTSNSAVLGFPLAVTTGYGDRESTMWVDVSIWGRRGEALARHITKGQKLAVSGELSQREHNDKRYLQLRCSQVTFAGERKQAQDVFVDDDVPF